MEASVMCESDDGFCPFELTTQHPPENTILVAKKFFSYNFFLNFFVCVRSQLRSGSDVQQRIVLPQRLGSEGLLVVDAFV
jgi:hypothetical protein